MLNYFKNRIFIYFSIFIALVLVASIIFNRLFKKDNVIEKPPPVPQIEGTKGLDVGFSFKLAEDISIPETASIYQVGNITPWTDEEVENIAKSFGFSSKPIVANDVVFGKTVLYPEERSSLTIYQNIKKLRFSQINEKNRDPLSLNDKEYHNIAESFIKQIPIKQSFYISFVNYIKINPQTEEYTTSTRNESNLVLVNLSPVKDNIKLLSRSPNFSLATITLNANGEIVKAEISLINPEPQKSTEYKLKTLDEIKQQTSNYILMSIDNGHVLDHEFYKDKIKNVIINSVELVYFYEYPEKNILQPVFLIRGLAKIDGFDKELDIAFYLPAFSE